MTPINGPIRPAKILEIDTEHNEVLAKDLGIEMWDWYPVHRPARNGIAVVVDLHEGDIVMIIPTTDGPVAVLAMFMKLL